MGNQTPESGINEQPKNPSLPHDQHHPAHHADMQADIASAKLAWEAWNSHDPKQIDHALEERHRILKEDPKAWKKAMKEIDAEEKRQAEAKAQLQKELQAEEAARAATAAAAAQGPPAPTRDAAATATAQAPDGQATAAVDMPPNAVTATANSNDNFAPPPPDTPAYNAAYNQPPAKFYGIDWKVVKLGVNSHGSIEGGLFIKHVVNFDGQLGLETMGDLEVFPGVKSLHARAGAGIGVNKDGFHGEAGAGVNAFNLAGGDLDVGARLGNHTGVDGDLRGRALLVNGQGSAGLSLDENGLGVHGGGNADILQTVGARGGGRFNLGPEHTGLAAGVGLNVAGKTLDFGPSVDGYSDGSVAQGIHLDPGQAKAATFFPTGDRQADATPPALEATTQVIAPPPVETPARLIALPPDDASVQVAPLADATPQVHN
jgi:hypothetical protein